MDTFQGTENIILSTTDLKGIKLKKIHAQSLPTLYIKIPYQQ